jgi:Cd2+/Zn2+-exporting ATPase
VQSVDGCDEKKLLSLALAAEKYSTHPTGAAIRKKCEEDGIIPSENVTDIEELSGLGVRAVCDGKILLVGNRRLMQENGIEFEPSDLGVSIYVALGGKYLGSLTLSDIPKDNACEAISALRSCGITNTVMRAATRRARPSEWQNRFRSTHTAPNCSLPIRSPHLRAS